MESNNKKFKTKWEEILDNERQTAGNKNWIKLVGN